MPFQKGNKLAVGGKGGGRKGYEYEKEELVALRNIMRKGIVLLDKMVEGTATINEQMRFGNIERSWREIVRKFHSDKSEVDINIGVSDSITSFLINALYGRTNSEGLQGESEREPGVVLLPDTEQAALGQGEGDNSSAEGEQPSISP